MKTPNVRLSALAAGVLSAATGFAQTTLVSDNFANVTVNGTGAAQTATSGAYTYYQQANNNLFTGSGGDALSFASSNNSQARLSFTPVSLVNVNDYITVSFTITYPSGAASGNSGLRFGLYNLFGDTNTAYGTSYPGGTAGSNPVGDTAQGYFVGTNPGGTGAAWSQGSNNLSKDLGNGAVTGQYSAVNGGNGVLNVAGTSFASNATFGSTSQTVSLTLTKTATGILVTGSVAGETFSATDTGANGTGNNGLVYTTFDTFFFGNGTASGAWTMDNLLIETTGTVIPEPSTAALISGGIALAGGVLGRRLLRRK